MIIKQEISLEDFEAWSGGRDTLNVLVEKDLCEQLEAILDDMGDGECNEGWTDTSLNDLLWFERDTIADWLDFSSWEELENGVDEEEENEEEIDSETLIDCLESGKGFMYFCDKSECQNCPFHNVGDSISDCAKAYHSMFADYKKGKEMKR